MTFALGRAPVIVERMPVAAADCSADVLFMAKAALKRAIRVREAATLQADQLAQLVTHLEAERRAAP